MTEPHGDDIATDLVEYLMLVVPGPHALASIGVELAQVVERSAIRILDMVVVALDEAGVAKVIEVESIESLAALGEDTPFIGGLLSRHDIDLVSLALQPSSAAIIIVVEDRWAESLSSAVRAVGGEVRTSERIDRRRVEAAIARTQAVEEEDE